jgi:hypothetical protein
LYPDTSVMRHVNDRFVLDPSVYALNHPYGRKKKIQSHI